LVARLSEPGNISDCMVSLREHDGKLFLPGSEEHKRCLYTHRYYERQTRGKLAILSNKYFICLNNTPAVNNNCC
jgi:hypothetical protein